ncbi:MAG: caspase family protein [Pseudomonadota bacterium]
MTERAGGFLWAARRRLAAGAILAALAGPAQALDHALLIGASHYDNAALNLQGPPNDVALLWRVLVSRGVDPAAIRVLAHGPSLAERGIAPVGRARRAAILREFERLSQIVLPGETVFIHLSGHGSQQPDAPGGDEADGLDEIFLPEDVGMWERRGPRDASVENALVDDEIGQALTQLRRRGAFVWFVMDSCHAGSGTRANDRWGIATRHVAPRRLGIVAAPASPRSAPADIEQRFEDFSEKAGDGGLVAFFAAKAEEEALEAPISVGTAETSPVHGLMTFALAEALGSMPEATFRDLALRILARYDGFTSLRTPTPVFEGPLDRPVLAAQSPERAQAFTGRRRAGRRAVTILAGALHGVTPETRFVLSDVAGDPLDADIAIKRIDLDQTVLNVKARGGQDVPLQMLARFESPPIRPHLRLRLAVEAGTDPVYQAQLRAALKRLAPGQLGGSDRLPDVWLRLAGERVYLLPALETLLPSDAQPHFQPMAIALSQPPTEVEAQLAAALDALRQGHRVRSFVAALGKPTQEAALQLKPHILRRARDDSTNRCPPKPAAGKIPAQAEPVAPQSVALLSDCDLILLQLTNLSDVPLDVTGYYLGAQGKATLLRSFKSGLRLAAGETLSLPPLSVSTHRYRSGLRPQPLPLGRDMLAFIAVERGRGADLSFVLGLGRLVEPGAEALPEELIDAASDSLSSAVFRWQTR